MERYNSALYKIEDIEKIVNDKDTIAFFPTPNRGENIYMPIHHILIYKNVNNSFTIIIVMSEDSYPLTSDTLNKTISSIYSFIMNTIEKVFGKQDTTAIGRENFYIIHAVGILNTNKKVEKIAKRQQYRIPYITFRDDLDTDVKNIALSIIRYILALNSVTLAEAATKYTRKNDLFRICDTIEG